LILQSTADPGAISLRASAAGMQSSTITLISR